MSLRNILSQVKSSNDLLYIALMSIYAKSDSSSSKMGARKFILPELVYLLDEKSLTNLITYFGGESIAIPKASVFKDQLYGIMAYYYAEIEGIKDWESILKKMDLPYSLEMELKVKTLMENVSESMEDIKLLSSIPNSMKL